MAQKGVGDDSDEQVKVPANKHTKFLFLVFLSFQSDFFICPFSFIDLFLNKKWMKLFDH